MSLGKSFFLMFSMLCFLIVSFILLYGYSGLGEDIMVINTYEECVGAKNSIVDVSSENCVTFDGKLFVRKENVKSRENLEFCGLSTFGICSNNEDCLRSGCSGHVCQSKSESNKITDCNFKECYNAKNFGVECGCFKGKCQWK